MTRPGVKRSAVVTLAALASLLLASERASAQCIAYGDYLHWVGGVELPSWGYGVAVSGGYAYVADRSGLQVIDIRNPARPQIVGSVDRDAYSPGVAVSGSYAYVVDQDYGLLVIDIANPASSVIVGSVDWPGSAYGVVVVGTYAFVAGGSGLQVIDVSDPASPVIVGGVETPGSAFGVAVAGNHAYVADYSHGLQVIDITNPASPAIVGSVDTPGTAYGVAVAGNFAYVADYGSGGLQVIDITSPANPVIVGSVNTPGYAVGVAVVGSHAYVADEDGGLGVIDVSDPASPTILGGMLTFGWAAGVAIVGDYAYVATYDQGHFEVFDITHSANPAVVGGVDTPGSTKGVAVVGSYAYAADYERGLQVIDITNPASPAIVGNVDTPALAEDVAVVGSYAYVADGGGPLFDGGLTVIDITNPASPAIVGSVETPGSAEGVAVVGVYAYIANGSSGLQVIDITNPTNPVIVGGVDTPGLALHVAVAGAYAYVADNNENLQVIDVSNPASPTIVGTVVTPLAASDVAVVGSYAYVAEYSGLVVLDITSPASPTIVGSVDTHGSAFGISIVGSHAYLAGNGLHVIDISNPASPAIVGNVETPGGANDVAVVGSHVYGVGYNRFWVLPAQCEPVCTVSNTSIDFDSVVVGRSKDKTFTMTNVTDETLTGLIDESCPHYRIVSGGGAYSLNPGDSVVVTVRFEPMAGGPFSCDIETGHEVCDVFLEGVGKAPPTLELALGILQNPYLTEFVDIFVTASEALDPASVLLTVDGGGIPMELIDGAENVWKADYKLTDETAVQVNACATSARGGSACASTSFGAFAVMTGEPAVVKSPDGVFQARIEQGSLKGTGYVLVIPSTSVEPDEAAAPEPSRPQTEDVGLSYTLSPASLLSNGSVTVEFHYENIALPPGTQESQLFIEHAPLRRLPSVIDPGRRVVYANAGALGEYRLRVGSPGSSRIADPRFLRLDPNYPNPFNPTTTIRFEIEMRQHVRLRIYDVSGRLVRTLVDRAVEPGANLVNWDGESQSGGEVSSGVYFAHIQTSSQVATRKMVLIR